MRRRCLHAALAVSTMLCCATHCFMPEVGVVRSELFQLWEHQRVKKTVNLRIQEHRAAVLYCSMHEVRSAAPVAAIVLHVH